MVFGNQTPHLLQSCSKYKTDKLIKLDKYSLQFVKTFFQLSVMRIIEQ